MKTLIIVIISLFTISIFSAESSAQSKEKILKVSDVMSDNQLKMITDSTGMISVPELCAKMVDYSPNTYYIDRKNEKRAIKIIKKAKQHMIVGDSYVFIFGYDVNGIIYKYKDDYGTEKNDIRPLSQPVLKIDTTLVKKYKFVFASR